MSEKTTEEREEREIVEFEELINRLREADVKQVRAALESEDGEDYLSSGKIVIEVVYVRWSSQNNIRRILGQAGETVYWESKEWDFSWVVSSEGEIDGSYITVYDRNEEVIFGNGMNITELLQEYHIKTTVPERMRD